MKDTTSNSLDVYLDNPYQVLFNLAPQGILFIKDNTILQVNKHILEIYGYDSAEELVGQSEAILFPEEIREEIINRGKRRQEGYAQPTEYETQGLKKDGTIIEVKVWVDRIKLLEGFGIVANVEDITSRKLVESKLIENEKKFRSIFDHAPLGIVMTDDEGYLIQSNPKYQEIVGYSSAELAELKFKEITYKDDVKSNMEIWDDLLQGKKSYVAFTKRYVRKDETVVPVNMYVTVIKDSDGSLKHTIAMVEDASDADLLLETQQELKRKEEQLYRAQKMESIARISGGIAHDVNNMLTGILGYVELMEMDDDGDHTEYLSDIKRLVHQTADLSSRLLTFSRQRINRPETVALNQTILDMSNMIEKVVTSQIKVDLQLSGSHLNIVIDANYLQQILLNIILNAKDAMSDGGTLTITTEWFDSDQQELDDNAVEFLISNYDPGKRYAKLQITDTGVGMDTSRIKEIFDPFFTTKESGTGLGLSTVYGIIKENHGFITVKSDPGKGTEFSVYFLSADDNEDKMDDDTFEQQPEKRVYGDKTLRDLTFLLVDDNNDIRNVMVRNIKNLGFDVYSVDTAHKALKVLASHEHDIDIIVTDMVMPDITGLQLAETVRKNYPHITVIIMTGYNQSPEISLQLQKSEFPVLEKPFSTKDLLDFIMIYLT